MAKSTGVDAKRKSIASSDESSKVHATPIKKTKLKQATATAAAVAGDTPQHFQRPVLIAAVARSTQQATPGVDVKLILQDAREIALTQDGASWVYHVPKWYQRIYAHYQAQQEHGEGDDKVEEKDQLSYSQWFDRVWDLHPEECGTIKLFGRPIKTPRFQQAYGQTIRFSGATFPAKPFPDELQHAVSILQRMLMDPTTGDTCLEAGLLNWYANGDHYMGPHTDRSVSIHSGSPIVSLTLGPAQRRFVFIPMKGGPSSGNAHTVEMVLGDGDLLIMGGTTQQTHKHALPKMKKCTQRRVNVTLRYFK